MTDPVLVLYDPPLALPVPHPSSLPAYGSLPDQSLLPSVESDVKVLRRFLRDVIVPKRSIVGNWSASHGLLCGMLC